MATQNNKVLIDAGTMSYYGQSYATVRFHTTCHNCHPSTDTVDQAGACLIRSRPERTIHSATFAQNFY